MKSTYSYSNISNISISFNIHQNNNDIAILNTSQKNKIRHIDNIRRKFPEQKIFRINSLIFNQEKDKPEIYTKYDCIYGEKNNSFYLIINEKVNYSEFTKDKLINILDFLNNVGINTIYLLINKKNKYYKNIIQDMLIVGFEFEKNLPHFTIDGIIYKKLKMSMKDLTQEIKQIDLI
jgi:hypothetical protein